MPAKYGFLVSATPTGHRFLTVAALIGTAPFPSIEP